MVRRMFVSMCFKAWINHAIIYYEKKKSEKHKVDNEIPEILTSTETSDDDDDDDYDVPDLNNLDEDDDNENNKEKDLKVKKYKIKPRSHDKQTYLEERYPNLKYKEINHINTEIYRKDID